ncbi:hypothetical protein [Nocardioides litoris]|uniref:hypothetical protein n=1 Tax=Nocardioides litoris TaxID=1926648 RepID=UPI0011200915|nr:hypothetical protein [Nocardioides litoris]
MTEKLKTLLDERASAVDFPLPDLDAVRRAGRRRRHSRYAATAAGGLAAAAVVAGLVVVLAPGDDAPGRAVDPAAPAGRPPEPTYLAGSTVHLLDGTTVVDVGRPVASYVATGQGFVAAGRDGAVWSVLRGADGAYAVERVGQTDERDSDLVHDPATSQVGWVDPSGAAPAYVVLDTATGEQQTLDVDTTGMAVLDDEADPASFYALDAGTAYLRSTGGAVALDLADGTTRPLGPTENGFDLVAARDGDVVFGTDEGLAIGPRTDQPRLRLDGQYASTAVFSPDGAWLTLDAETATVVDTASGELVELGLPGFSVGYDWLPDGRLLALAVEDPAPGASFLACTVPTGSCETLAGDQVDADTLESGTFVLPAGADMSDD